MKRREAIANIAQTIVEDESIPVFDFDEALILAEKILDTGMQLILGLLSATLSKEGIRTEYDYDEITGTLGKSARSYQRTMKRKSGKPAWREVLVSAGPKAEVQISFDGRTYTEPVTVTSWESLQLNMAARAVRIKAKRSAEHVTFSIMGRE